METEGGSILAPVKSALVAAFDVFRHDEVAIGLSLAMIVLGVVLLLWFWLGRMRPLLATLRDARETVRDYADEDAFVEGFDTIDEALSGPPLLAHGWREFKGTLILPDHEIDEHVRYTVRPVAYLNAGSAEAAGINLQFQKALPNFFVGFGLLFTFLGLVAALFFANQGVASPNIAEAQAALRDLLHAATFKFMTSVAGLVVSLSLAIANRVLLHRLQHGFDELCHSLERRMTFVTVESIAFAQYRETARQNHHIERFRAEFVGDVSRALHAAQEPLATTIGELAVNLRDMNRDALAQMAQEFIDALSATAAKELRALAETLDKLNGDIALVTDRLNQSADGFQTKVGAASEGFETRVAEAAGGFEAKAAGAAGTFEGRVGDAAGAFKDSAAIASQRLEQSAGASAGVLANGVEQASDGLGKVLERAADGTAQVLGGAAEIFSRRLEDATKTFGDTSGQAASSLRDGMTVATSRLDRSMEEAAGRAGRVLDETGRTFAERTERALQTMDQPLSVLTARWEKMETTFAQLDERLRAQFEAFEQNLAGINAALAGLGDATASLQLTAQPIAKITKTLAETSDSIAEASNATAKSQKRLRDVAGSLGEQAAVAEAAWEDHRQRFEATGSQVAEALGGVVRDSLDAHAAAKHMAEDLEARVRASMDPLDERLGVFGAQLEVASTTMKSMMNLFKTVAGGGVAKPNPDDEIKD